MVMVRAMVMFTLMMMMVTEPPFTTRETVEMPTWATQVTSRMVGCAWVARAYGDTSGSGGPAPRR